MTFSTTVNLCQNNLKVFYQKFGTGPPLILLHGGWATGQLNWSEHFDILAKHFTVYVPDQRGHGRTNNPAKTFSGYEQLASDTIELIAELKLNEKPLIMGHSSGAVISLLMSAKQPDLIARQVLIGIHPYLGKSEHWKRGTEKFFSTKNYRTPPAKWSFILHQPQNASALWSAHHETPWFELLQQSWPMWNRPIGIKQDDYQHITCPTHIIIGSSDEFGSVEEARIIAKKIRNARFDVVPNADHMFVVNQPELLAKLVLPFLLAKSER